jgi:hypothetical protein
MRMNLLEQSSIGCDRTVCASGIGIHHRWRGVVDVGSLGRRYEFYDHDYQNAYLSAICS